MEKGIKVKSKNQVMKDLAKKFNLEVVDASEFYGYQNFGIWIRDGIYDLNYGIEHNLRARPHPLNDYVDEAGWFIEPYDSETFLVYPI